MKLLVLGGGGFLGYHLADEALVDGHEVTVLSRSGHSPLDGVEVVTGDRTGDLSGLDRGRWDAVVDTFSDTDPGAPAVRRTAELLSGRVGVYASISGISVYAPAGPAVPNESGSVRRAGVEPDDDPLQARSLGKLAAETVVREAFSGAALFPRVGILVGPRDPSSRFTDWPVRITGALVGHLDRAVLVPGDPDRTVQYSDARDVAAWIVRMLVDGSGGTFNVVGPGRRDTLRDVLEACIDAAVGEGGTRPEGLEFVAVDEDALRVAVDDVPDEQRPLWYPEDQIPQTAIDSSAAFSTGLTFRPLAETVADTLAWAEEHGDAALTDGDLAAREQDLLRTLVR